MYYNKILWQKKVGIVEVSFLQFVRFCTFRLSFAFRYRTSWTNAYGGSASGSQRFYGKYKTCANCKEDVSIKERSGLMYTGYFRFVIAFSIASFCYCFFDGVDITTFQNQKTVSVSLDLNSFYSFFGFSVWIYFIIAIFFLLKKTNWLFYSKISLVRRLSQM